MKGIFKTCTYWKQLSVTVSFFLLLTATSTAQNPIVIENQRTGNPASEWDITGAGNLTIQGFATDISVNKGQTVHFKIACDEPYTIDVYRLGYYNGLGARKVGTGVITATLPQTQPPPAEDPVTGIVDCGNWAESAHFLVHDTLPSGFYIAKLIKTSNGVSSHIAFIVRDDASHSDLFFQASDATWQAYNIYGGNSLYNGTTSMPAGHASKVSYNRPFLTRDGGGGGEPAEDWLFNAEYPMIRFLERNGYDITYTTNVDAARRGNLILNHKIFLSVGHDEYWSAEQRASVEAARNAGVHLAFFSGNEVYWKTRWENGSDGTPFRTLVCYKEGTLGEVPCGGKCDPSPVWTGLWRSGGEYDAGKPENALTGQISWDWGESTITVPAAYKDLRFWRHTSITLLGPEDQAVFPQGTLGYEFNWEQYPEHYPHGRITMSSTTFNGKTHKLSLYRHSSGALVFGAGTVQWSWGLDDKHDRGNLPADPRMQQATINLLADMGAQPATLMVGMQATTASTDFTAPTSVFTSHQPNDLLTLGTPVTITGTTTENGGGVIAGVEISMDNGATWQIANGTTNWSISWTPIVQGPITIKVRGFDDSGNMEEATSGPNVLPLTIGFPNAPDCPCTIFEHTDVPTSVDVIDNPTGIEVGLKFKTFSSGYITGVRFYKNLYNTGIHTGTLWSATGTQLARVTFTNETASGWQEATFATPVAITPGTVYVISYHSPTGHYSETNPFFTQYVVNNPLVALPTNGPDGANGIYLFTGTPSFPTQTYQSSNYYVDVVFHTTIDPDVTAPELLATTPVNGAVGIGVHSGLTASFKEPLDPASINTTNIELRDAANNLLPIHLAYNNGLYTITITHSSPFFFNTVYTATLKSGPTGVRDVAGNPIAADITWSFTTAAAPPLEPGPGGPILVISSSTNQFSRYPVEILKAEGLNAYTTRDIAAVTPAELNNYDVILLGEVPVNGSHLTMFTDWLNNHGGTLVAMRPNAVLAPLFGLTPTGTTLADKYLLVDNSGAGTGIVNQTIQYHSTADLYTLTGGATALATLYSAATTATPYPAVSTRSVGSNGGTAVAFTYDLAKSVVYTRQGNPAWAGTKREPGAGPIRSYDMYFGGSDPSWIDFNKIAIPQADEQQRLLTNIIIKGTLSRKPLPRFWFLPSGHKAAIVMTGDDHALNGTEPRFEQYKTLAPNTPQDVADWKAIRGTSYLYNNTPITPAKVAQFESEGFEIGLHLNTSCSNFTADSYRSDIQTQRSSLYSQFPSLSPLVSNRTHCVVWSDWATAARVQAELGIRLDVNYYYWPSTWVLDRPGMFTGSGMPMRFAELDGTIIDCYQVPTQMTDESLITYSTFSAALLDKAIGAEGYYGVFAANMHTDEATSAGSDAIIASALARQVPVVSAKQMLTWLDGRNNSSFANISWNSDVLTFSVNAALGSYNIQAMLPLLTANGDILQTISRNGNNVPFTTQTIKGIQYAFFSSITGDYTATYANTTKGNLLGKVTLQGRPAAPHAQWQTPLKVDLYQPGNNTTPVYSYNVTTDQSGAFRINDVQIGTYNMVVKSSHTLKVISLNKTLVTGDNTEINFGTLKEGDVDDDNFIRLSDFSLLLFSFNKGPGDPGYDVRADLNGDGIVSLADFSLLLTNFNQQGPALP